MRVDGQEGLELLHCCLLLPGPQNPTGTGCCRQVLQRVPLHWQTQARIAQGSHTALSLWRAHADVQRGRLSPQAWTNLQLKTTIHIEAALQSTTACGHQDLMWAPTPVWCAEQIPSICIPSWTVHSGMQSLPPCMSPHPIFEAARTAHDMQYFSRVNTGTPGSAAGYGALLRHRRPGQPIWTVRQHSPNTSHTCSTAGSGCRRRL